MNRNDRGRFDYGQQLFHAGERARATEILSALLPSVRRSDADATAAVCCLLAESWRGFGNFLRAQKYYEEVLSTRRHIAPTAQRGGFFSHYGPRAILGLIMVLRRRLSPDYATIRSLIEEARNVYSQIGQADFNAQLDAVEGLFERQLFRIDAAVSLLDDAAALVATTEPPFQFINPDHISALLSQACLIRSLDRFRAGRLAADLLSKSETGNWSRGVASAVLLTLRHRRKVDASNYPSLGPSISDEALFESLNDAAVYESDPFLMTELHVQRLLRGRPTDSGDEAANALTALRDCLEKSPTPMILLRAVEVAVLSKDHPANIRGEQAFQQILRKGRSAIDQIATALAAYDVGGDDEACWRDLLEMNGNYGDSAAASWHSEPLVRLRALAWP